MKKFIALLMCLVLFVVLQVARKISPKKLQKMQKIQL